MKPWHDVVKLVSVHTSTVSRKQRGLRILKHKDSSVRHVRLTELASAVHLILQLRESNHGVVPRRIFNKAIGAKVDIMTGEEGLS